MSRQSNLLSILVLAGAIICIAAVFLRRDSGVSQPAPQPIVTTGSRTEDLSRTTEQKPPVVPETSRPPDASAQAVFPNAGHEAAVSQSRPAKWAVKIERPGLPNFHRVTQQLYRGAQPTADGMKQFKEIGIKTIIDLRAIHSDRDEIGDLGFSYEHISMKAWHPEDEDVVKFLKIATDPKMTPVFVHCQHGADRTGTMCAIYRVAVCGWSKADAVREMTEGGFGFHEVWGNLVTYINNLDIDKLKKEAGLN
jgi:protein tyrosine/serine phosphatase